MNNQHDLNFDSEFAQNHNATVNDILERNIDKTNLEIDGIIMNDRLYKFQKTVDGKVLFTLTDNSPENRPPVDQAKIADDQPADESIRPGPRPKMTDSQLTQRELERRNRRRAINRKCARKARERRQRNESDLERKLQNMEELKTSWERKYSDLEERYRILSRALSTESAVENGINLLN